MKHTKSFSVTILALLLMSGFAGLMVAPGSPVGEASAYEGDGRGYVCITFDDVAESVYTIGYPVLSEAGLTATVYPVVDWIGTNFSVSQGKAMSQAQLLSLQAAGWEIGSHSVTHREMTTLSLSEAEEEFADSKTALEAMGFNIDTFAYPGGADNDTLRELGSKYYLRQRDYGGEESLYLKEYPAVINTTASSRATSFAVVTSAIDRAIAADGVIVFTLHGIRADGVLLYPGQSPDYLDYTIQDLVDLIRERMDSDGLRCINFRDLPNSVTSYI